MLGLIVSANVIASDNSIYIDQAGDNSTIYINQYGASNVVRGIQSAGSGNTTPATISGDNLSVTIDQIGASNTLNLGFGSDNLTHRTDGARRYTSSVEISNLTNVEALYNYLSTFSGTHFLAPRAITARLGVTF